MPWATFFNPLLLFGLFGVALPVIAHLLSRRKFDVVEWGAMQFLNPSRRTRRRLRLEELLLLLLRIGLICVVVFSLARPSVNSGFLLGYQSAGSRDVVLVIDGSNTMARTDGLTSLHQKAVRRATEFLETLSPGDTVAIIDARDRPRPLSQSLLQDREVAQEQLRSLLPPAGAGNLEQASETAIGLLGRGSHARREVVVFTDRQRAGWQPDSEEAWKRFDEVVKFPSVRPSTYVVDVSRGLAPMTQNVSLGQVQTGRDLTVPDFPIPFQVAVRNAGNGPVEVPLQVLINGQRLPNMDGTVSVPAQGETTFSRTLRFQSTGTNLVTVKAVVKDDAIERDNESHVAVRVSNAIPVLLVEGSQSVDRRRWDSFFAQLALSPPANETPWILARRVRAADLKIDDLEQVKAVVLADVASLPAGLPDALLGFAAAGHGVMITLGEATTPTAFDAVYRQSGLLPTVSLQRTRRASADVTTPTTIAPYSLKAGWLDRFRESKGASLLKAVYQQWWLITLTESVAATEADEPSTVDTVGGSEKVSLPITVAQLTSGDPLLVQTTVGDGTVLLMTSSLSTAWNSLPAQPDFVPFIHEALFQLVSTGIRRNVDVGAPLMTELNAERASQDTLQFAGPFDQFDDAIMTPGEQSTTLQRTATFVPGVYHLQQADAQQGQRPLDSFVVNYDHAEDFPEELTEQDLLTFRRNERLTFVDSPQDLVRTMYADESRSELWWLLLFGFLVLLVLEVWMTRRLVMRGHAGLD
ncbi:MAG: VWA domain-containing protein [Planctomycetaceae bacterium]|nr:VWA domain-containing protein [Planctomycetaceae bacterium]